MQEIRVGVIGIGFYATVALVPGVVATGKARVVAVSRRHPGRLEAARAALGVEHAYTDWREMLDKEKLDAVMVSTAHNAHAEPTIAALSAGCHVLVEKPMALSSRDARAMVRAARARSKVLMVGYNGRCVGAWRSARQYLSAGDLGTVRQISVTTCTDTRWFWRPELAGHGVRGLVQSSELNTRLASHFLEPGYWRATPQHMGGGMLVDIGTHVADVVLWLGGAAAREAHAFMENLDLPAEAISSVHARLRNGVIVSLDYDTTVSADDSGFYGSGTLTVYGDRGYLTAKWAGLGPHDPRITVTRAGRTDDLSVTYPTTNTPAAFMDAVTGASENICPGTDGARVVSFLEAAYRSGRTGKVVRPRNAE